tara:strand:- start:336 stop:554 length:219 start_codon:yes stop_codon:yes gene_type:complete
MKQLELNFEKGKANFGKQENKKFEIPDFDTWYYENSHERRQFGEKPYSRMKATSVYADLIESDFFRPYKRGK